MRLGPIVIATAPPRADACCHSTKNKPHDTPNEGHPGSNAPAIVVGNQCPESRAKKRQ
jgi:hypothetical protein